MPCTASALLDALRRADLLVQAPTPLTEPSDISMDSRAIRTDGWFVAVRGSHADGHRFVGAAVANGAGAVVVEEAGTSGVPEVVVRDSRRAANVLGRAWHGDPGMKLRLVGVTGTNGKTTTTGLVRHLLNAQGTAGSIGTLGAFDGAGEAVESTAGNLTTPGPIDLQATLAAMVVHGCTDVAVETSSHSLDQGRLDGLTFAAGIFTNLTRDHLDYHGTMDAYLAAKLRLSALLGTQGVEIVNADDPAWGAMPPRQPRLTFGIAADAHVRAEEVVAGADGSRFVLVTPAGRAVVALPLLGDFNVSNALAAAATALALGVSLAAIAARLSAAPQVPGRMERIAAVPCVVLRDYAHTPDALERALRTLRPLTTGRLIVLFGCGGDRDVGKRPIMGRLAAELADVAYVTSDNPRTEDPARIVADIEAGMGTAPRVVMVDRLQAIHAALASTALGDTLLLAGKGHETYQVVGTTKLPFDERAIVRAAGAT
jgi:UDP-N-acetylmuramoyl-L-alanyl-D-glutamate--2,6-diaminopimelate ligase